MKNFSARKALATGMCLIVFLPTIVIPRPAHANLPVIDVTNIVQSTISAVHDLKDSSVSFVLKPLAMALARAAIQSITMSTVKWINGGFNGSPAYATNLKKNLRQVADGEAQKFLEELANTSAIHSPFMDDLVTNVGAAYYLYSSRDSLKSQLGFTLDQSSADADAFLKGDFGQGGWNAWFSTFMNPANNPYGAQMIAAQKLEGRISGGIGQRVTELGWGNGFLSWKGKCTKAKPTSVTGSNTAEVPANLSDAEGCLDHEIETPGSVIATKLQKVTDLPLDQLGVATSINQVVGALAQQLVSKILGGGSSLRGSSQPSSGGGSSVLTQSSTGSNSAEKTEVSEAFQQTLTTTKAQVTAYKNNWQTIQTAAQAAEAVCGSNSSFSSHVGTTLTQAQTALTRADSTLNSVSSLSTQISNTTPSTSLTSLSSNYQDFVSSSDLPSDADLSQASIDSTDTGTSVPVSLYTQMSNLAHNGCTATGVR